MRESPFWLWYKGTGGREEGTKPRLPPPLASLLACASSHAPSSFSFSPSEASATSQHTRKGKAEGKGEKGGKKAFSAIRKVAGENMEEQCLQVPRSLLETARSPPRFGIENSSRQRKQRGGKKLFPPLPPPAVETPFPSPPSSLSLPCCWHYNGTREEEERG